MSTAFALTRIQHRPSTSHHKVAPRPPAPPRPKPTLSPEHIKATDAAKMLGLSHTTILVQLMRARISVNPIASRLAGTPHIYLRADVDRYIQWIRDNQPRPGERTATEVCRDCGRTMTTIMRMIERHKIEPAMRLAPNGRLVAHYSLDAVKAILPMTARKAAQKAAEDAVTEESMLAAKAEIRAEGLADHAKSGKARRPVTIEQLAAFVVFRVEPKEITKAVKAYRREWRQWRRITTQDQSAIAAKEEQ